MDNNQKKHVFLINQSGNLPTYDKYRVWHPATDLFETENQYIVKVEISGM